MKKVFFHAAVAALLIAAASCERQDIPGTDPVCPSGYHVEVVKAVCPSSETRASVDGVSGKVSWASGDVVAFHLSNGTYLDAEVNPATGEATLIIPDGVVRDGYAVYPASAAVAAHAVDGDLRVNLPSEYDFSGKLSSMEAQMPMVAVNDPDSDNVKFKHVGGLMQLNLSVPSGVQWLTVALDGQISGEFTVSGGDSPSIAKGSTKTTLTVTLCDGLTAGETEAKILLPVPVGSYAKLALNYGFGAVTAATLSRTVSLDFARAEGKKLNVNPESFSAKSVSPFYLQALEEGSTVSAVCRGDVTDPELFISLDDKATWQRMGSSVFTVLNGQRAYILGLRSAACDEDGNGFTIKGTGKLKAGGKIITLTSAVTKVGPYHFSRLFEGNEGLVEANVVTFPTGALQPYCYARTYEGCVNLTKFGIMPGQSAAPYCYSGMYRGCTSMVSAPKLAFTTLAEGCYEYLFEGCTALTGAPDLLAPAGAKYCYRGMFKGCTNLSEIVCALQTWSSDTDESADDYGFTLGWVEGVAASGRFIGPQALDMTVSDVNHVPVGWNAFYDDSLDITM